MESVSINPSERVGNGGDEVGATSDGFCDENIWASGVGEFCGCVHEGVESAAEASAGDLLCRESAVPEHLCIDEFAALVIGDQTDLEPFLCEVFGKARDRCGLSCTKETADHDVLSRHIFWG